MPIYADGSAQSIVPYKPSVMTAYDGTTYKSRLDALSAVAANIAGLFFVYPTSPVSLSVNVDVSFNYLQVGFTPLFNSGASPATVALAGPVSNTRIATIYFDMLTSSVGATYGTTSASPTVVMPDQVNQIALAFVTLTYPAITVTAANIQDARSIMSCTAPLWRNLGILTANQVVECMGASAVTIFASVTTNINVLITLAHLQVGAHVHIQFNNSQASTMTLTVAASSPQGTSFAVTGKYVGGTAVNLTSTGAALSGNTGYMLAGASIPSVLFMTIV